MLREFFSDGIIYAISSIISRGLFFILIPIYTRALTIKDYGNLDISLILISLINIVVSLEISQGLARYYSDLNSEELKINFVSSAFIYSLCSLLIFTILSIIFSDYLSSLILGSREYSLEFKLIMIYSFINGIFYFLQNLFRYQLESKKFLYMSLIFSVGCLIFTLIFTIYFSMELDGVITSLILSSFLGVLYGIIHSRKTIKFFIDFQALKKMIFFSLPLVLSSLLLWINTYADRILIRTFLGIEDVGIYAVGFRISNITSLVALGFQGALMPLIYANYRNLESKESLKYIFALFLSVALFFIFFLTVFSKEFVQIISTDEYIAASKVIFYLSLSILFTQIYIFMPGISLEKKTNIILMISFLSFITNIALNIILIPSFGILGASIATMLASFLASFFYVYFSQKFYFVEHSLKKILTISSLIILVSFLIEIYILNLYLKILFFLIALGLLLWFLLIYLKIQNFFIKEN